MNIADKKSPLIIGIGNEVRGDDCIGLEVVRRVKKRSLPSVEVSELKGDISALIEAWEGREKVILIDAVSSQEPAGTIFRFDASQRPLPQELFHQVSTHSLNIAEAIEIARALSSIPRELLVYGIVGRDFQVGFGLIEEAENKIESLVSEIVAQFCNSKE